MGSDETVEEVQEDTAERARALGRKAGGPAKRAQQAGRRLNGHISGRQGYQGGEVIMRPI